eukprot:CAMPEP_0175075418 /NCGR_PEP_ID=MMETSP0052_2-20121109/21987_1 /TAXON_ID=51329 ORGANISM="Polytomella parva, Strain SAG 63-3" /NCGR_SAMPLE_ID=MMETSP0052_2 /ASSEMBLY_ACC=CAM_ASM_000194 /LENGTH=41 /DNA_ID= /DNA_START= /DNA_END= /DNA_ORIENTATION=
MQFHSVLTWSRRLSALCAAIGVDSSGIGAVFILTLTLTLTL